MKDPDPISKSFESVLEGARALAEKHNLPEAEPVDELSLARSEAEARYRRKLHRLCEDWGVPFADAQQILRGAMDDTDALKAARKWRDLKSPGGLLVINGPNGCGKTFAASWLVIEGPPCGYPYGARDDKWPAERHPRFIQVSQLMQVSMYGDNEEMRLLRNCSVLAIDDVGTEYDDDKGAFAAKFSSLIAHREKAPVWTVITTNLKLRSGKKTDVSFEKKYGARIFSRLHGHGCGSVHLYEDDMRRKRT